MNAHTPPSKTSEAPAHPLLSDWAINRKLEELEQDYGLDQEKKPRVKRLRQYAEDFKGVYQAEIELGRVVDTADLWAGVYEKLLVSVRAKINSLLYCGTLNTGCGLPAEMRQA